MTESAVQGEDMELECGVCFQIYNAGRRCPRQLRCKHSFCECCLNLLVRSPARETEGSTAHVPAEVAIVCPLCRYPTILLGGEVRGQLPVDEDIFERMLSTGVLNDSMSDDDDADSDEFEKESVPKCEERTDDNSSTDAVPRSRGRRLWRSFKRFCDKVIGEGALRDRHHVLTDEDMRDLVLMACMM